MRISKSLTLVKEKPGVISPGPIWILFAPGHLYAHTSLLKLIYMVITEWEHDRHLAG